MDDSWIDLPKTKIMLGKLVQHDSEKWGCLDELKTVEQVSACLRDNPPTEITELSSDLIKVYYSRELGTAWLRNVDIRLIDHLLSAKLLDPDTKVFLRYRHGNLFALLPTGLIDEKHLKSVEIYLYRSRVSDELLDHTVGPFFFHHKLYNYNHLHCKESTLRKIVDSKRFSCVRLGMQEDFELIDIPY